MEILNKNAFEISPIFSYNSKDPFDPYDLLNSILIDELYRSDNGKEVKIKNDNKTYKRDFITDTIADCLNEDVRAESEIFVNDLFNEVLTYKDNSSHLFDDIFVTQAANKNNMLYPSDDIIYTYQTDIIPNAKNYINNKSSFDELFVSFDFINKLNILAFAFEDEKKFDEYKKYIKNESSKIKDLPQEVIDILKDFDNIKLDKLTETIILREEIEDNNDINSFPRILMNLSMKYFKDEKDKGIDHLMPFSFREILIPKTITFVNIEKHANSSLKNINDSWTDIKKGLNKHLKIIDTKKINKLQEESEFEKKLKKFAKKLKKNQNLSQNDLRKKNYRLTATKTKTPKEYINIIKRIIDNQSNINRSLNAYKQSKNSFQRANRRNPDDFNKQGKITSTKYKPDLHLYIDTSGSIDEKNYRESVKLAILLAKKLNVNLYFNSFSHYVSNSTKLPIKNKSTKQIYEIFRKVPKVNGGTDFNNVWQYINKSKKRSLEISLMITDFGYLVPNSKDIKIPKNLYYIPCSFMDFNNIKYWCEQFMSQASYVEPKIRQKILT